MIDFILSIFRNRIVTNELLRKNRLLNDTLIYLKYDLDTAVDSMNATAINDMIFDIEEELDIPKKDRIVSKRICSINHEKKKKSTRLFQ